MHDGPGKVNKAVNFVQEGHSDLTSQGKTEEDERMRLEVDSKRKERKSLQEQLKENAAMKQEEFNLLVKEKNSFNRLSEEDIDFYRKLNSKSKLDHQQMEKYLIRNMKQFEERKAQVLQDDGLQENHGIDTVEITKNVIVKKMKSRQRLKGVIKKKKTSSGGAKPA